MLKLSLYHFLRINSRPSCLDCVCQCSLISTRPLLSDVRTYKQLSIGVSDEYIFTKTASYRLRGKREGSYLTKVGHNIFCLLHSHAYDLHIPNSGS